MIQKATRTQIRTHNRQLVLRNIFNGEALNRAALADVTGLTKPAISSLVAELIDEGFVVEGGFGNSTESGGKRPRLLQFVPNARQVIGIDIQVDRVQGILTNLDNSIVARHYSENTSTDIEEIVENVHRVVNGLSAQLNTSLMCVGVGFPGLVDPQQGCVQYSAKFSWQDVELQALLVERLGCPVYIANSTQLASKSQFAFETMDSEINRLATIMVDSTIGIGVVTREATIQYGGEIGYLRQVGTPSLHEQLAWEAVLVLAQQLAAQYHSPLLNINPISYLHLKYYAHHQDQASLEVLDHLSDQLANLIAWLISIIHPDQISLVGKIADLGDDFLTTVIYKTSQLVLPELVDKTTFSIDARVGIVALGAATNAIQLELGLI